MKKVLLIALFTVMAGTSQAMVFGGSNLGILVIPNLNHIVNLIIRLPPVLTKCNFTVEMLKNI